MTPSANNNGPAFGVFAALVDGTVVELQDPKAMVQVIHNSADVAAAQVDIYYNGTLLLDNFAFSAATGFVEVDAEKQISIAVAPSTSTSVADALATFNYTLDDGGNYILVANGVLAPANYAVNPEGRSTAFDILVYPTARQEAEDDTKVELLVLHGATDAPTVDVVTGGAVLVNDLVYSDFQEYLAVDAQSYILGITPGNDNNNVLLRYTADLTGLEGGVATVIASGFLDPSTNQSGEGFALIAVLADGTVITLPTYTPKAMVQVIHNSADVAAAQVDIYYNGTLLLDNFAFRAATGFVEVDAEKQISIAVAPSTSTSVADALATFNYTLEDGGSYILVANGVLAPANYAVNPEGRSTAFDILVYPTARQEAEDDTKVELLVLHGATDAPTVDVVTGGAVLVNDLVYSDFQEYLAVDAQSYILGITPGNDNNNVLLRYTADLTGLEGGVATVIASGFLDPSTNQSGEGFALIAVLADGTVITLPTYTPKAMVQVIHNSADVAAAQVDIYYNGTLLLDNFAFRTATGFVEVDAETQISIAVAPSTSTSVADALATYNYTLDDGGKYIIVANGVLNPASYAVNPDSKVTDFNLFVYADARSEATESDKVDLLVFHGVTDAPTIDVTTAGNVLVDDIAYTDFQGYLSVAPASYDLQLTPADDNDVIILQYLADLSGLAGGSATLIASGFLSPSDNQDGEGFALLAILADGTVINLPISTLSVRNVTLVNATVYPNPTTNSVTLETTAFSQANYRVVNIAGQEVTSGDWSIDNNSISLQNLQNGVYFIELFSNSQVYRTRVQVIK